MNNGFLDLREVTFTTIKKQEGMSDIGEGKSKILLMLFLENLCAAP
jgi:hypothetical protein